VRPFEKIKSALKYDEPEICICSPTIFSFFLWNSRDIQKKRWHPSQKLRRPKNLDMI
jgi:hypothetical protein